MNILGSHNSESHRPEQPSQAQIEAVKMHAGVIATSLTRNFPLSLNNYPSLSDTTPELPNEDISQSWFRGQVQGGFDVDQAA